MVYYELMFDVLDRLRDDLRVLTGDFDAAALDGNASRRVLATVVEIERLMGAIKLAAVKRLDETGAWASGSHRSLGAFVATVAGTSVGAANAMAETAAALDHLPVIAAAMSDGRLSAEQLREVTTAGAVAPHRQAHLLETAATSGLRGLKEEAQRVIAAADPDGHERRHARAHAERSVTTWIQGAVGHLKLETTVDDLARVKAALDPEARRVFRTARKDGRRESFAAYAADALSNLVTRTGTRRSKDRNVTMHLCVDVDALRRGRTLDGERCEIPGVGSVPVSVARAYLTDAFLTIVIAKGKDIVSVTHPGRYIAAELRTAFAVAGLECTNVDCDNRGYLEIDHDHDYASGGPTNIKNLGPLCWPCHRKKSAGWKLGPTLPNGKRSLEPPGASQRAGTKPAQKARGDRSVRGERSERVGAQ